MQTSICISCFCTSFRNQILETKKIVSSEILYIIKKLNGKCIESKVSRIKNHETESSIVFRILHEKAILHILYLNYFEATLRGERELSSFFHFVAGGKYA